MKEIIKITLALTISCLIAGTVMGGVFMITARAKQQSEIMNIQQSLFGLLGYNIHHPAPPGVVLLHVYRYIVEDDSGVCSGYLFPVQHGARAEYGFLILNQTGQFVAQFPVADQAEKLINEADRNTAVQTAAGASKIIRYADDMTIVRTGDQRTAYVLMGKFSGFKTFIHALVALNPDFGINGMEITSHEEDPGLGGEIEKEYFKNQFKGKSFEKLQILTVTRDPLPEDYRQYLETQKWQGRKISQADAAVLGEKYRRADIHAISGATISSTCVTQGVKQLVKNFAYRIALLDRAIQENRIPAAF
jgi:Na+-translocating ferredoxin:NAD+ oxidoreductase subunit G